MNGRDKICSRRFSMKFLFRKTEKTIWEHDYGSGKWKVTLWIFCIIPIYSYIKVIPEWCVVRLNHAPTNADAERMKNMTEQERKGVIDIIWSSSSINIDYLKKMSDEELRRLYKDKFQWVSTTLKKSRLTELNLIVC